MNPKREILQTPQTEQKIASELPLEEFFKTYHVGSLSFAPDETELCFISDKSGLSQLYVMPVRGGQWRQLVETADAVVGATWCPMNRDLIFFLMDQGGNENYHILLTTPAGGAYEDLTPWEGKRAMYIGWSKSGRYLYYNTNRRDDRFMDTYRLDIETMRHELIFENNTTLSVEDISPDDRTLILNEFINVTSSNLYSYDIATKAMKPVATQEGGEANFSFADFSPEGDLYYILTDKGSEFTHLTTLNPATGEWNTLLQPPWDVGGAGFSFKGTYFFTAINEDGMTRVELRQVKTGEAFTLPPLPKAEIIPAGFSRSEKFLRIVVNADHIPGDQYLLDVERHELVKLTDLFDNCALRSEMLVESELIRYKSFDGLEIPAWLYKPRNIPEGQRLPIVLDIHGGPMAQETPGYNPWTQFLVSRGYIVVAPNVRGSTGYGKSYYLADDQKWGEDPLQDVVWLKRHLATLPYADIERTVIWGGSYGGYMVLAALAFAPDEFALGIDWVGPSNLFTLMSTIPPYWEPFRAYFHREIGNPDVPEDAARMYRQSPLFFADRMHRPLLIVQGRNDPRVKVAESDQVVEAIRRNGRDVDYLIFEDEGHGLRKRENKLRAYQAMFDFMARHLAA